MSKSYDELRGWVNLVQDVTGEKLGIQFHRAEDKKTHSYCLTFGPGTRGFTSSEEGVGYLKGVHDTWRIRNYLQDVGTSAPRTSECWCDPNGSK